MLSSMVLLPFLVLRLSILRFASPGGVLTEMLPFLVTVETVCVAWFSSSSACGLSSPEQVPVLPRPPGTPSISWPSPYYVSLAGN